MKNSKLLVKLNLFLIVVTSIIWLGSYIARHLAVYQLFEPKGLVLRDIYSLQNLSPVLETLSPLLVTALITYPLFIILFIIYLFISKINLKYEGWLFICVLIIFITMPFEVFLLLKDYKIVKLILMDNSDLIKIVDLLRERITILSSFSLIEIFSYFAVIFLSIFKPLRKTNEIKREGA